MRVLVVKSPFKDYQRGHRITDAKTIDEILSGPHQTHCVASEHADEPVAAIAAAPVAAPQEEAEEEV